MNRYPLDLSLYLVTNRVGLELEDFFRIIHKAIKGGVKIVQLREKGISAHEFVALAKKLQLILKPMSVPLIINDNVDVAHVVDADGVHLGQSDVKVSEARKILGKRAIIGLSVENITHVIEAQNEDVNYLAASPVFFTKTKSDCSTYWRLDDLRYACSISFHPMIAIGGINKTNVDEVLECGVAGVAVVSAIFDANCPVNAATMMGKKMEAYGAL
ncbi:MAG: thiamine phosphate synthase [Chlamydiales bacterium]|nr:thiamine phosphate synthase [Chlamydiales bacterium]